MRTLLTILILILSLSGRAQNIAMFHGHNATIPELHVQPPMYYLYQSYPDDPGITYLYPQGYPSLLISQWKVTTDVDIYTTFHLPTIPANAEKVIVNFYIDRISSDVTGQLPAIGVYFVDWSTGTPSKDDFVLAANKVYPISFQGPGKYRVILPASECRLHPSLGIGGLAFFGGELPPDSGRYSAYLETGKVANTGRITFLFLY